MEKNSPLVCCLCNEKFQKPKIMHCLHSFCLKCLQKLQQTTELPQKCQCPLCHQTSDLTGDSISGLKTNLFLARLVNEADLVEALKSPNVAFKCCVCQRDAVSRCFNCAKFLCQGCQKVHCLLSEHNVLSLEESRAVLLNTPVRDSDKPAYGLLALKSKEVSVECSKHHGEKCWFFCQTCKELICRDCTVVDHCGSDHKYISLEAAAPIERQSTMNLLAQLNEKLPDAKTLLDVLGVMGPELRSRAEEEKRQVKALAKRIREDVDAEEKHLLWEIRVENQKQIKQLNRMKAELKSAIQHMHNSLQSGSVFVEKSTNSEFLWLYSTLLNDLQGLNETQLPEGPSSFSFQEEEINIHLGQLEMSQMTDIMDKISKQLKEVALQKQKEKTKPGTGNLKKSPQDVSSMQPIKGSNVTPKERPTVKQQSTGTSSESIDSNAENLSSTRNVESKKSSSQKSLAKTNGNNLPGKPPGQPPAVNSSTSKPSAPGGPVEKTKVSVVPSDRVLRSSSASNTISDKSQNPRVNRQYVGASFDPSNSVGQATSPGKKTSASSAAQPSFPHSGKASSGSGPPKPTSVFTSVNLSKERNITAETGDKKGWDSKDMVDAAHPKEDGIQGGKAQADQSRSRYPRTSQNIPSWGNITENNNAESGIDSDDSDL